MTVCQEMIERSPLAMGITEGPEHTLRFVNAAFCMLQQKPAEEIIGHPVSEVISGAGAGNVLALLERVYSGVKSGITSNLQYSDPGHLLADKSYLVWGLPQADGHTESLVIQVTDLTAQNLIGERAARATQEISALNSEIREIAEQLVISGLHHLTLAERNRIIAETLQYSILWRHMEKSFGTLNVASCYEPSQDEALVGGDFFDAFRLPNQSVMLVVGDVTGKGLKAAARTVEIIFALRAFAQDYKNPADMVFRLNQFICDFHHDDDEIGKAQVALSLIVVDPLTGAAQAASAGAEPPLILRASGAVEELTVRGLLLGIDHDTTYETTDLTLDAGDTLMMTTDGILETRVDGNLFGSERLLDVAQKAGETATLQDIGKAIVEAARLHGGGEFSDDVCLLLVRRDPETPDPQ